MIQFRPINTASKPFNDPRQESPEKSPAASGPAQDAGSAGAKPNDTTVRSSGGSGMAEPSYHPQISGAGNSAAVLTVTDGQAAPGGKESVSGSIEEVNEATASYAEDMAELNEIIYEYGGFLSPEELQVKIDEYKDKKAIEDPGWAERVEKGEKEIADKIDSMLEKEQAYIDENGKPSGETKAFLESPEGQYAMSVALKENPDLLVGSQGAETLETLKAIGLSEGEMKAYAQAYVQSTVQAASEAYASGDPDGMNAAQDMMDALSGSGAWEYLGISQETFKATVSALENVILSSTDEASAQAAMQALNAELSGVDARIADMFRMTGLTSAAYVLDPDSVAEVAGALMPYAGFSNDAVNFFTTSNFFNKLTDVAGRAFFILDAFNTWNTLTDPGASDSEKALTALSFGLSGFALVAGMMALPVVGFYLAAGALALNVLSSIVSGNEKQDAHDAAVRELLKDTGLDEESVEFFLSYPNGPTSFLFYAQRTGVPADSDAVVDWINGMSPEDLAKMSDALSSVNYDEHGVRDGYKEKVESFKDGSSIEGYGAHLPTTLEELEIFMEVMGIDPLSGATSYKYDGNGGGGGGSGSMESY